MLLVKMYDQVESGFVSRLSAADVKICFDLHIPCYLNTEATDDDPEMFLLINAITEEGGFAGSVELSVTESGKLAISGGIS